MPESPVEAWGQEPSDTEAVNWEGERAGFPPGQEGRGEMPSNLERRVKLTGRGLALPRPERLGSCS